MSFSETQQYTISKGVIKALKPMYACHVTPQTLISGSHPQYSTVEMKDQYTSQTDHQNHQKYQKKLIRLIATCYCSVIIPLLFTGATLIALQNIFLMRRRNHFYQNFANKMKS